VSQKQVNVAQRGGAVPTDMPPDFAFPNARSAARAGPEQSLRTQIAESGTDHTIALLGWTRAPAFGRAERGEQLATEGLAIRSGVDYLGDLVGEMADQVG
jgi:hypothetical protein